MRLKDNSVRLDGLHVQMLFAMNVVADVLYSYDVELVVTSVNDGTHMDGSKHYTGDAFDARITDVLQSDWPTVRDDIKAKLGHDFDVVLETKPPHVHIEWDPKR